MQCPVCEDARLAQAKYEGVPVRHCLECRGFLVLQSRADGIRQRIERPAEVLLEDAKAQLIADTRRTIRCPACRETMRKQSMPGAPQFHLDICRKCWYVWFDGGELALYQLAWEASPRGREAARMQQRHRTMSDEERGQLEADIESLPRVGLSGSLASTLLGAMFSAGLDDDE